MDLESVTLKLPRELLSGAQRVATAREVTIGHMVRVLLKREVDRQLLTPQEDRPDTRLVTALQALLSNDMAKAKGWNDLQQRLRPHGYELRPSGDDAALYKSSCNTRVCNCDDLGVSHNELVARFGTPLRGPREVKTPAGVMPAGRIDPTRHALLTRHLAAAKNWPDLINRLAIERMELRAMGAGLGIYISATGRHLCNTATVGAPYKTLIQRFGTELPGSSQERGAKDTSEVLVEDRSA